MVDVNICKKALVTGNFYMYKGKVKIPPLAMQDDTLGISSCGKKSVDMNNFLNQQTNVMQLQFGTDKCVKMHIQKKHKLQNPSQCPQLSVDSWKDEVKEDENGKEILVDEYEGKIVMKDVTEKKYLGNIISNDLKNKKNIQDRTNKAAGNIEKIISGLQERPYGRNKFRAAKVMRQAMLIGPMLNNSETWINVTKDDVDDLTKPETTFNRKLLATSGNPSKVFMTLETGFLPVKYVMMANRLKFLNYTLNESMETTVREVYETQKCDSKRGDFVDLVQKDIKEIELDLNEEEIKAMNKMEWKTFIDEKIKVAALKNLNLENSKLDKTKHIDFKELKMSEYLIKNKESSLTQIIFSIRSGTLDIKSWNPWKYDDILCVGCGKEEENMTHFMSCMTYGEDSQCTHWQDIWIDNCDIQYDIAFRARRRLELRDRIIEADEAGQDISLAPMLHITC